MTLESLCDQRLAIDASIWLYHFIKSLRDPSSHQELPNAPLLGFFRRLCKLLFYGIRPVFVFDGAVPPLKRAVIERRRKAREQGGKAAEAARARIVKTRLKQLALKQISDRQDEEIDGGRPVKRVEAKDDYALPSDFAAKPADYFAAVENEGGDEEFETEDEGYDFILILMTGREIDLDGALDPEILKSLPLEMQREILHKMRQKFREKSMEQRLRELEDSAPTALDFSRLQVERIAKRHHLTRQLEEIEQEQSVQAGVKIKTSRIAAQRGMEYVLIKNNDNATWTIQSKPEKTEQIEPAPAASTSTAKPTFDSENDPR